MISTGSFLTTRRGMQEKPIVKLLSLIFLLSKSCEDAVLVIGGLVHSTSVMEGEGGGTAIECILISSYFSRPLCATALQSVNTALRHGALRSLEGFKVYDGTVEEEDVRDFMDALGEPAGELDHLRLRGRCRRGAHSGRSCSSGCLSCTLNIQCREKPQHHGRWCRCPGGGFVERDVFEYFELEECGDGGRRHCRAFISRRSRLYGAAKRAGYFRQ